MTPSTLMTRLGLAALALSMLGLVGYVLLHSGPLAPLQVTVIAVQEGSLRPAIFGIGTVEARRSWMVGPTVAGRVLSVHVDVGDFVKAGQLLAEMDSVDLDQRIVALDATVARAGSSQDAARAQLADATARRELAILNAQRNQNLATQNFISAAALESRLQEKASAEAILQAAQANLRGAGQDFARIQAERAGIVKQRGNVRMMAPGDGIVTSRDAEAGSTVVAGQAVLRLIDPASLWVKLRVDQGRSAGLAVGLAGSIVLRSQPQAPLVDRVARVEVMADSVTEERIAQVAFDALAGGAPVAAALGELAEVTLQLPETKPALLVPNASVQRVQGQVGVWRIRGGKPEFSPVRLGANSLDGQVQVLEGLQAGYTIVVHSQKELTVGARVQVVDALVKPTTKGSTP
jgi:HlyD family secretion protein